MEHGTCTTHIRVTSLRQNLPHSFWTCPILSGKSPLGRRAAIDRTTMPFVGAVHNHHQGRHGHLAISRPPVSKPHKHCRGGLATCPRKSCQWDKHPEKSAPPPPTTMTAPTPSSMPPRPNWWTSQPAHQPVHQQPYTHNMANRVKSDTSTQCQLCLGSGHTAVTARSHSATIVDTMDISLVPAPHRNFARVVWFY